MDVGNIRAVGAAALAQRASSSAVAELSETAAALALDLRPDAVAALGSSKFIHQSRSVAIDGRSALAPARGALETIDRLDALHDVAGRAASYAEVGADRSAAQLLGGVRDDASVLRSAFAAIEESARSGVSSSTDRAIAAVKQLQGAKTGFFEEHVGQSVGRALDTMPGRISAAGSLAAVPNRLDDVLVGNAQLAESRRMAAGLADGSPLGAALAARQSIDGAIELASHAERQVVDALGAGVSARVDGYDLDRMAAEGAALREHAALVGVRGLLDDAARYADDADAPGLRLEAEEVARIVDAHAASTDRVRAAMVDALAAGGAPRVDTASELGRIGYDDRRAIAWWLGAAIDGTSGGIVPPSTALSSARSGLRRTWSVDSDGAVRASRSSLRDALERLREVATDAAPASGLTGTTTIVERALGDATRRHGTVEELRAALAAIAPSA